MCGFLIWEVHFSFGRCISPFLVINSTACYVIYLSVQPMTATAADLLATLRGACHACLTLQTFLLFFIRLAAFHLPLVFLSGVKHSLYCHFWSFPAAAESDSRLRPSLVPLHRCGCHVFQLLLNWYGTSHWKGNRSVLPAPAILLLIGLYSCSSDM